MTEQAKTPSVDDLMWPSECYVRECFRLLGDELAEEAILDVTRKVATVMHEMLKTRQFINAMTEACFTPEEQAKLRDAGL